MNSEDVIDLCLAAMFVASDAAMMARSRLGYCSYSRPGNILKYSCALAEEGLHGGLVRCGDDARGAV